MKDVVLTRRESEVAELFAWGATKKDVANRLFLSERTVENHARNIYAKTGCTKVNELSAWWFCTTFHISFDLSPLKRKVLAVVLGAVLLPQTLMSAGGDMLFARARTSARVARPGARRRSDDDCAAFEIA